jgi:small subunit ribosomal protein S20
MANHASAAKRARQTIKRTARNRLIIGALRSSVKRARVALGAGDATAAGAAVQRAAKAAAKAATKGVIHANTAARLSSRLRLALNKLAPAA